MSRFFLLFWGIFLPFFGTALGAGAVFFLRQKTGEGLKKALFGFSAGVMAAASVWSLLIPSLETSGSVFPSVTGFLSGALFFLLGDQILKKTNQRQPEGSHFAAAVTLHNLPEGMAVGMVLAQEIQKESLPPFPTALVIALGIALQNIPEGAIISLPKKASGKGKASAFLCGVGSGTVEPLGALAALFFTSLIGPLLPYLLAFAAGAMVYVISSELIPELRGKGKELGVFLFHLGFILMMTLDVVLG